MCLPGLSAAQHDPHCLASLSTQGSQWGGLGGLYAVPRRLTSRMWRFGLTTMTCMCRSGHISKEEFLGYVLPRVYRQMYAFEDDDDAEEDGTGRPSTPPYLVMLLASQFVMSMAAATLTSTSQLTLVNGHGMTVSDVGLIWGVGSGVGVLVMRYTSRVEERRAKLAPEDRKVTAFSFAFSQPFNTVLIMLFVGSWTIAVGIGDKLLAIVGMGAIFVAQSLADSLFYEVVASNASPATVNQLLSWNIFLGLLAYTVLGYLGPVMYSVDPSLPYNAAGITMVLCSLVLWCVLYHRARAVTGAMKSEEAAKDDPYFQQEALSSNSRGPVSIFSAFAGATSWREHQLAHLRKIRRQKQEVSQIERLDTDYAVLQLQGRCNRLEETCKRLEQTNQLLTQRSEALLKMDLNGVGQGGLLNSAKPAELSLSDATTGSTGSFMLVHGGEVEIDAHTRRPGRRARGDKIAAEEAEIQASIAGGMADNDRLGMLRIEKEQEAPNRRKQQARATTQVKLKVVDADLVAAGDSDDQDDQEADYEMALPDASDTDETRTPTQGGSMRETRTPTQGGSMRESVV